MQLRSSRFLIASAAAALAAPSALSQTVPVAAGSNGFFVVAERGAVSDQILLFHPEFGGAPIVPPVTLAAPIARTLHRRNQQAPAEAMPLLVIEGASPLPHVVVPTFVVGGAGANNVALVESVHFSPGFGCSASSCITVLGSGPNHSIDYDLLDTGAGIVFAQHSDGASTIVTQLTFAGPGGATAGPTFTFSMTPTPHATRMSLDPTGRVLVPLLNGVGVIDPVAGVSALVATPGTAGGAFIVGTNLATNFATAAGENVVFGLRAPAGPGHAVGFLNPTAAAAAFTALDPFGAGQSLAAGFHEVAVGAGVGGPIAAFLTEITPFNPSAAALSGNCGLVDSSSGAIVTSSVPIATAAAANLGPFGNIEVVTSGTGDSICFYATLSNPAGLFVSNFLVAVGLGSNAPLGSISSALLGASVEAFVSDRPLALAGGSDVQVDQGGLVGVNVFQTFSVTGGAAAPTVTAAAAVASGRASMRSNTYVGTLPPTFGLPSLPAALVGAAGLDGALLGAPLAPTALALPNFGPGPYLTLGQGAGAPGQPNLFVRVPGDPLFAPDAGARIPVFNFTDGLGTALAAPLLAYPGAVNFGGTANTIEFVGAYAGNSFYSSPTGLASNIAAF